MKKENVAFRDPEIERIGERICEILHEIQVEVDHKAFPDDFGWFNVDHNEETKLRLSKIEEALLGVYADHIRIVRGRKKSIKNLIKEFDRQVEERLKLENKN